MIRMRSGLTLTVGLPLLLAGVGCLEVDPNRTAGGVEGETCGFHETDITNVHGAFASLPLRHELTVAKTSRVAAADFLRSRVASGVEASATPWCAPSEVRTEVTMHQEPESALRTLVGACTAMRELRSEIARGGRPSVSHRSKTGITRPRTLATPNNPIAGHGTEARATTRIVSSI